MSVLHALPKPVLVALLRVLVWLDVADELRIEVWAAIRAIEICEEREWVVACAREGYAWPARGGTA